MVVAVVVVPAAVVIVLVVGVNGVVANINVAVADDVVLVLLKMLLNKYIHMFDALYK